MIYFSRWEYEFYLYVLDFLGAQCYLSILIITKKMANRNFEFYIPRCYNLKIVVTCQSCKK